MSLPPPPPVIYESVVNYLETYNDNILLVCDQLYEWISMNYPDHEEMYIAMIGAIKSELCNKLIKDLCFQIRYQYKFPTEKCTITMNKYEGCKLRKDDKHLLEDTKQYIQNIVFQKFIYLTPIMTEFQCSVLGITNEKLKNVNMYPVGKARHHTCVLC